MISVRRTLSARCFPDRGVVALLAGLCTLTGLNLPAHARQIDFAGYTWDVRDRDGGPGPNLFSDDADDVWVDDAGRLHLTLQPDDGVWSATEVVSTESFGYGEYRWKLATNVEDFDPNTVLGLFTYENDSREIDIEFAKFGQPNNPLGSFTKQGDIPLVSQKFEVDLTGTHSTHLFHWTPDRIDWASVHGHTDGAPEPHLFMAEWQYEGPNIPPDTTRDHAHMNLWGFRGNPPTNGLPVEVVISDFAYTPIYGDYNNSGQVEQSDLDLVLQNWGVDSTGNTPAGWINDLPSGQIEQSELDKVLTNWGSTAAPDFRVSAVPEPLAAGLLLTCGVTFRIRRLV